MSIINSVIPLFKSGDRVFLTVIISLPIEQVNNYIDDYLFRVEGYDESSGTLYLKPEGKASMPFERASSYHSSLLQNLVLKKIEISSKKKEFHFSQNTNSFTKGSLTNVSRDLNSQSFIREWEFVENIKCDLRKANFIDGFILFDTKVIFGKDSDRITIRIENPLIRTYFDSIKNYIWTLLGADYIYLKITFLLKDSIFIQKSIENSILHNLSDDILDKIDDNWVEQMIISSDSEEIVSLDSYVKTINQQEKDEKWLLANLLTEQKTIHYYQLLYLSEKQVIEYSKLSITGKPLSFIFLINENETLFLVWEAYSIEVATYIWKLEFSNIELLDIQLSKFYETIKYLRKNNRLKYRKEENNKFFTIDHNYSTTVNGFEIWKNDFEEILKSNS